MVENDKKHNTFDIKEIVWYTISSLMDLHQTCITAHTEDVTPVCPGRVDSEKNNVYTTEGGQKDVSSLEGTKLKKKIVIRRSPFSDRT